MLWPRSCYLLLLLFSVVTGVAGAFLFLGFAALVCAGLRTSRQRHGYGIEGSGKQHCKTARQLPLRAHLVKSETSAPAIIAAIRFLFSSMRFFLSFSNWLRPSAEAPTGLICCNMMKDVTAGRRVMHLYTPECFIKFLLTGRLAWNRQADIPSTNL